MSVAVVSSDDGSQPMICTLESPHSEPLRAARVRRSSMFSCGDDGQLVRWQAGSTNDTVEHQKQSKSKQRSYNKKPY
jgi:hypothetical protein